MQARCGPGQAIDVDHVTTGRAHKMVMVVAGAQIEPSGCAGPLDTAQHARRRERSKHVVHGLNGCRDLLCDKRPVERLSVTVRALVKRGEQRKSAAGDAKPRVAQQLFVRFAHTVDRTLIVNDSKEAARRLKLKTKEFRSMRPELTHFDQICADLLQIVTSPPTAGGRGVNRRRAASRRPRTRPGRPLLRLSWLAARRPTGR